MRQETLAWSIPSTGRVRSSSLASRSETWTCSLSAKLVEDGERGEVLLEGRVRCVAKRLGGLGAGVDGDHVHTARRDRGDGDLEAPERIRERRRYPGHPAVLAERHRGARGERLTSARRTSSCVCVVRRSS
jgi:hypothetical protein